LGEHEGKSLHVYSELAEREMEGAKSVAAPIFIAVDKGNSNEEVAVRLPKGDRRGTPDRAVSKLSRTFWT
jgi:hypothetical protein